MNEVAVERLARFLKALGDERIGFRDWAAVREVYMREARQILDFLASTEDRVSETPLPEGRE